jgi:hypothetical protein
VTAKAKEILGQAMQREKSLSLSRRGKAAHMVFLLSRRLMRDFHAVIGIDRIEMLEWSKNSTSLVVSKKPMFFNSDELIEGTSFDD